MRKIFVVLTAIITIVLLGYFHYEACAVPESANEVHFFFSHKRTCQLPGLVYE